MIDIQEFDDITSYIKRAPIEMTNVEWQSHFNELRKNIRPSKERKMRTSFFRHFVDGFQNDAYFVYCGDTQWQYYCKFINSVLSAIRRGEKDYCYHIYQIKDLLRFEHDNLKVTWLPELQCFEVSLGLNQ